MTPLSGRIILAALLSLAVMALFAVAPSWGGAAVGGAGVVIVRYWLGNRKDV